MQLFQQWPSLTAMPAMPEIQRRRLACIPIRECLLGMLHVLPAAAASAPSASFAAGDSLLQECAYWADVRCLLPKNCWLQQKEVVVAQQQRASYFFALVGRFDSLRGMVGRESIRTPRTEYGCWRRQYGDSTELVRTDFIRSIRSTRETWIHFQNWAAIAADQGESADTVQIQCVRIQYMDPSRIATDRASAAIRSIRA